jgi:hypothetical protein
MGKFALYWSAIGLPTCVATVGGATAIYGFLYELYYFLRYGNWPRAIDLLTGIASYIDDKADTVLYRWVMTLDWVVLKGILLHWPLSAVGLGTGLVMSLLILFIWALMPEDWGWGD